MFSLTSEYALKALVYLTQRADQGAVPGREIAEELGIPRKYLSAILRDLVRSGVLSAAPGKTGGFRLSRDPKKLPLVDVVAPFESVLGARKGCPFGNVVCNDTDPCAGHEHWSHVKQEMLKFLNDTCLYDVSVRKESLGKKTVRKKVHRKKIPVRRKG